MADRTVGDGQTYATIAAGIAAAVDGVDTVTIYDRTPLGEKIYNEAIISAKDLTIRSNDPLRPYGCAHFSLTSDCVIQDFIMRAATHGLNLLTGGLTITLERGCMFPVGSNWGILVNSASTVICNNMLSFRARGAAQAPFGTNNAGAALTCNFCKTMHGVGRGYYILSGALTCNNCISFGDVVDFQGAIGGDYNATNQASGAPGGNSIHNLTLADLALARDESPPGGSQYPADYRAVEARLTANSSALQNAGNPVAGVTDDINGRTRDVTNPNIGPSEDFPGFAGAAATAPPDKTTGVSMAVGNARLEGAFTTPSACNMEGFIAARTSAAALSFAGGGVFSHVEKALAASTAYLNRSICEITGEDGANLENGTEFHTLVIPGFDNVFKSSGFVAGDIVKQTPVLPPAPAAPVIAFVSKATGQFTISVTGDPGVTNQLRYRTTGAWTDGQTRSGDGNITQTGLTDGTVYQVEVQAVLNNVYGPSSNTLWIIPAASGDVASTRLAAYLDGIRALFVNSSNLLAWIQETDGGEGTNGHVQLGYTPNELQSEQIKGPNVYVWPENFIAENEQSAKTYRDHFDIVAEIVWYQNFRASDTFLGEINHISNIIDEAKAKGIALDATYGGEVFAISAQDLIMENPHRRIERRIEIRFSVRTMQ